MKKRALFFILFAVTICGFAQDVDNFDVGPYEVDYKGEGDFKFRLRKGIDLYEYFGLKKDTVIVQKVQKKLPVKNAVQVNLFYALPRYAVTGNSNIFGIDGSYKFGICESWHINTGVSLGLSFGKYNEYFNYYNDVMFEGGIPISIEYSKLDYKKATLYAGIGITPTFYSTIKAKETICNEEVDAEKQSGFYIAPRIDFGGYIPLNNQIFRIGVFAQYNINCTTKDGNIYKDRIGRFFVGANIGLLF